MFSAAPAALSAVPIAAMAAISGGRLGGSGLK
jgi:hypothetical protein